MKFENQVKTILKEIGLTPIQCEVYLYILKNSSSTASNIAKNLKINRTNTYTIIEKLKDLNLLWEEQTAEVKLIHSYSHENIQKNLIQKEKLLDSYQSSLKKLIPEFNSYKSSNPKLFPRIRTYSGLENLDEIIKDILDLTPKHSEILLFTNQQDERNIFTKKKHNEFVINRIAKNINIKVLAVNNGNGLLLKNQDKGKLRETRLLPDSYHFYSEIYIYNNKISMIDFKNEIVGIIMESDELFNIHSQFFQTLWEISK